MTRYNSLNEHLKSRFGCKVYKLSLSGGMSCPNRDGTTGTRGCVFCADGSGAFAERGDIASQLERARARLSGKVKSGKYIAYFQSYTNTYASPEYLERIFGEAIQPSDIVGLSVATRPDCLQADKLAVLKRLADRKPLWVELGLQTSDEKTADAIRRGYPNAVYERAVRDLHAIGAEVVTHVIIGLPHENRETAVETVRYASDCRTDGIKLQLLHVLDGTDLATAYRAGAFETLSLDAYIETLEACLRVIPDSIVIHRLTGDGDKKKLIAPLWSGDKKTVLNEIKRAFYRDNVIQGDKIEK